MFEAQANVMLYVDSAETEKDFWAAIGFTITKQEDVMGYLSFDMKPHPNSSLTVTVFDKAFISQVSPEVLEHQPSLLFQTQDLTGLHQRIATLTDHISDIQDVPFLNFHFASPSGQYFSVIETKK